MVLCESLAAISCAMMSRVNDGLMKTGSGGCLNLRRCPLASPTMLRTNLLQYAALASIVAVAFVVLVVAKKAGGGCSGDYL